MKAGRLDFVWDSFERSVFCAVVDGDFFLGGVLGAILALPTLVKTLHQDLCREADCRPPLFLPQEE